MIETDYLFGNLSFFSWESDSIQTKGTAITKPSTALSRLACTFSVYDGKCPNPSNGVRKTYAIEIAMEILKRTPSLNISLEYRNAMVTIEIVAKKANANIQQLLIPSILIRSREFNKKIKSLKTNRTKTS